MSDLAEHHREEAVKAIAKALTHAKDGVLGSLLGTRPPAVWATLAAQEIVDHVCAHTVETVRDLIAAERDLGSDGAS